MAKGFESVIFVFPPKQVFSGTKKAARIRAALVMLMIALS
jgi:hypothetical protein